MTRLARIAHLTEPNGQLREEMSEDDGQLAA
jgi:hypothetical protein